MIYPTKEETKESFSLTEEEIVTLKKNLVLAIEKKIEHSQDRALDAVKTSELGRQEEILSHLYMVIDLEPSVRSKGGDIMAKAVVAYDKGTKTISALASVVSAEDSDGLVDSTIFAKRLIELKTGKELTPIIVPKVIEPIEEPIEGEIIIKG